MKLMIPRAAGPPVFPVLHEFPGVLVVMDGKKTVAVARKHENAYPPKKRGGRALGGYLLRVYGASFTDPRARIRTPAERAGGLGGPSNTPELLLVRSRREARSILASMTGKDLR